MFHGFTGQRDEPHRLFVKAARLFSKAGVAVLRFDFRCSGESEGDFLNMTISGEIKDARASLDFLCRQPQVDKNRLAILGFSMGGFVASFLGSDDPRVKSLVLWSAGARASTMFPNYIRMDKKRLEKWIRDGMVDLAGNVLGSKFLADLKKLGDSFPLLRNFKGKALIIHGDKDRSVPVAEAFVYKKVLGPRATSRILKGADHTYNRKDWEKIVLETTAKWLKKNL